MGDSPDRSGDIYVADHGSDHGHTDFDHDSGQDHSVNYSDGHHVSFETGLDRGYVHLRDHGDGRIYD